MAEEQTTAVSKTAVKNEETKKEEEKKDTPKTEKNKLPELKSGYKVKVYQRIREGKKERIQMFEGIILSIKGQNKQTRTMTVYKESNGVGIEKIFPLSLPTIEKIEITGKIRTRRAKLYYLTNYQKKLKESQK